jgi:hypothetical protein
MNLKEVGKRSKREGGLRFISIHFQLLRIAESPLKSTSKKRMLS